MRTIAGVRVCPPVIREPRWFAMSSPSERSESAWAGTLRQNESAAAEVRVLPLEAVDGRSVLERLGVSERSTMGALASHTGGLLIDHGWLRDHGGGSGSLAGIAEVNDLDGGAPPFLVVAEDVLGGRFAIDGGGLGIAIGEVCYFGPDTLAWTGIGGGYSAFVGWVLSGGSPSSTATCGGTVESRRLSRRTSIRGCRSIRHSSRRGRRARSELSTPRAHD